MAGPDTSQIYTPRSIGSMLERLKGNPGSLVFAGGTYIMTKHKSKYPGLAKNIIHISDIEELTRINRTERYIEIGACASINSILNIGSNVLPEVLYHALRHIATPTIRNLATLGGNICAPDRRLSSFPVLVLLDTRIELRRAGASRWIPINKFIGPEGNLTLQSGEVVTRIRIPLASWNLQVYRRPTPRPITADNNISFCGLADIQKGLVSDIRFAIGSMGKSLIRYREIEAELVGKKLPLSPRTATALIERFEQNLERTSTAILERQRIMISRLLDWFFSLLDAG